MSEAQRLAWKVSGVGFLLGIFFVLRDHLADWEKLPGLDLTLASAHLAGSAVGCAVLFWIGGYAYGLYRQRSKRA
jgi:hypothetical protein